MICVLWNVLADKCYLIKNKTNIRTRLPSKIKFTGTFFVIIQIVISQDVILYVILETVSVTYTSSVC